MDLEKEQWLCGGLRVSLCVLGQKNPRAVSLSVLLGRGWGRSFQCRHPGVAAPTADASGAALATGMFFLGSSAKVWIRPPSSAQPLASPLNALEQTLH